MPDPVVVLIEDEPQIRRFLRVTLTGQGYRLFEATTGADGLVEVGSRQPDVVIVDLGLPDIDGIDVIRRLREVWGPTHTDQAHYVRVYMAHLRHKLEAEPARPRYLLTEPGVGYRLAAD